MSRLYVPGSVELLRAWAEVGTIGSDASELAFEAPDDSEEGEYAALMSAADASTELRGSGGRRIVVVVDGAGPAYPLSTWAAIHADTEDRGSDADPDDDLGWFATSELDQLI